jgi:uncharacterized membrane protein
MSLAYNQIAGRSLERLGALSDGVFAVAVTLIVLEIRVPVLGVDHPSNGDLWNALLPLWPRFLTYLLSFMTLGIFWNGQQTQLHYMARTDRHLAWIHIAFLAAVALMPFSTSLLADYIALQLALVLYWVNIAIIGTILYAGWAYARRAGLTAEEVTPEVSHAVRRRIVVAQALYALGAALSLIDTRLSIGFIVSVQLNFAIAPPIPILSRI